MATLFIFMLELAGVIGWIANIVQIVHAINLPITGLFILKCIAILVIPLGSVLGWVGMF